MSGFMNTVTSTMSWAHAGAREAGYGVGFIYGGFCDCVGAPTAKVVSGIANVVFSKDTYVSAAKWCLKDRVNQVGSGVVGLSLLAALAYGVYNKYFGTDKTEVKEGESKTEVKEGESKTEVKEEKSKTEVKEEKPKTEVTTSTTTTTTTTTTTSTESTAGATSAQLDDEQVEEVSDSSESAKHKETENSGAGVGTTATETSTNDALPKDDTK
jgi:hypothetical protein